MNKKTTRTTPKDEVLNKNKGELKTNTNNSDNNHTKEMQDKEQKGCDNTNDDKETIMSKATQDK